MHGSLLSGKPRSLSITKLLVLLHRLGLYKGGPGEHRPELHTDLSAGIPTSPQAPPPCISAYTILSPRCMSRDREKLPNSAGGVEENLQSFQHDIVR